MAHGLPLNSEVAYYSFLVMTRSLIRPLPAFAALWLTACSGAAVIANAATPDASSADAATAALLAEVKKTFTVHGKPIPPEIFRDLGDGGSGLLDGSIWVTVDVAAATGSNLYADDITQESGWISQKKAGSDEVTGYNFRGTTDNGLLVVLADWSGGGSGDFRTLHILDLAAVRAFDDDGKIYQRIYLTNIRSIPLGDR